jgi:acyl-CoA synthetase (AMP-forming)/AMP-acid ligase II
MVRTRAVQAPDATFAVFGDGERWSNSELAQRVWRRANALRDLGVRPGDYVSSWLSPGKVGLEAWFAINAAGGLYAPLRERGVGPSTWDRDMNGVIVKRTAMKEEV